MAEERKPFLKVDFVDGGTLEFANLDEVEHWINDQKAFWNWFVRASLGELGNPVDNLQGKYRLAYQHLLDRVQQLRQDPENNSRLQALHNQFSNTYSSKAEVLKNDHPFALLSNDIANSHGPFAGAAALAFLLNIPVRTEAGAAVIGIIQAKLIRDGIDPKSPNIVATSIQKLVEEQQKQLVQQNAEWADRKSSADSFLKESKAELDRQIESHTTQWKEIIGRFSGAANDAVSSIRATEAAYTKQMELQASVNYWTDRGKSQRKSIARHLIALSVFAAVAALIAWAIARAYLPALLQMDIGKKPEAYAIALTLTLLFSTVIFWAARVLVRLYLSAHHLAIDAEERVVMIQTYLALIKEEKLDPEERTIVLTPLFRASSDGIVKDDGAPDLSTAAMLSRVLEKR